MLLRLPELKNKLDALIENAKQVGLRVNFKKTKLMRETYATKLSTIYNNSEEIIEDVEQFCYLGNVITKDGGAEADVNLRISRARHRLNYYSKDVFNI